MRFKIGQKIVCRDKWVWIGGDGLGPKDGDIVTVERYAKTSDIHIVLLEWDNINGGRDCFNEKWFEPLADISELESLLNSVPETQTVEV